MSTILKDFWDIIFGIKSIADKKYEEADKYLLEKIKGNGQITNNDLDYAAKLYGVYKLRKEYKNIFKILNKTKRLFELDGDRVDRINETLNGVDEDWLNTFFDKARLISDDDVQELWAQILKNECFARGKGIRRVMLDRLSLLDHQSAQAFEQLCNLCYRIQFTSIDDEEKSESYPIPFYIYGYEAQLFFNEKYAGANPLKEYAPDLNEIEILNDVGLITYNMESDYADMLYGSGKARCDFFVSDEKVYSLEINDSSIDYMLSFFVRQIAFSKSGLALYEPINSLENGDKRRVKELVASILPSYIEYILIKWEDMSNEQIISTKNIEKSIKDRYND